MNENNAHLAGVLAGVLTIGGAFVGFDYLMSKEADPASFMVKAKVVQEDEAYKKLGFKGDYTTAKKNGLSAMIGKGINKAFNYGNNNVAYIAQPSEVRYSTCGGLFFSSKNIVESLTGEDKIVVISGADIANPGDMIEFHPTGRISFLELIGKRPGYFIANDGPNKGLYPKPFVNPAGLRKLD